MKILQYCDNNIIRLGVLEGDEVFPVDFSGDMVELISEAPEIIKKNNPVPLQKIEFAPVLTGPSKIVCVGLNYFDHIRESHGEAPDKPVLFSKYSTSLLAHKKNIIWNTDLTKKVDFEAELAVVMGKTACNCPEEKAMENIFGYTCANDVSARDLQFGDGQWVRGKSLDTFCPLGPWIVTADEIADPNALSIKCSLNDVLMQDSNTDLMLFKVPELISFISGSFTLLPGDIILTGTPHGVGTFREPSIYMKDGDRVTVEIEGIGKLTNNCRTITG
ncbi:MAG: fumarylacetoacetate hydrolase family protein [Desulfobacteraceae bacterium]|jgi:2-keto-4-pentenoate hydratase/2-oxohepta-3-ene-1,7-dioic acid hydratase in catechol pathway